MSPAPHQSFCFLILFFFNVFLETEQPSLPDSSELHQTSSLPTALQSTANNHFDRIVLNRSIDFFLILGRLFCFNRQTIVQHETESSHDSVNHVSPPFPSNNVLVVDFSNMNATKQEPTWYPAFVTSNSTPHRRTRNRFCRAGCTGKPRPAFFSLLFESSFFHLRPCTEHSNHAAICQSQPIALGIGIFGLPSSFTSV